MQPAVYALSSTVQQSGFENFTIKFPWSESAAHMLVAKHVRKFMAGLRPPHAPTHAQSSCFLLRHHWLQANTQPI